MFFICDYGDSYNRKKYIMVVQVIIPILCKPRDRQITNKMTYHRLLGCVNIKYIQY